MVPLRANGNVGLYGVHAAPGGYHPSERSSCLCRRSLFRIQSVCPWGPVRVVDEHTFFKERDAGNSVRPLAVS